MERLIVNTGLTSFTMPDRIVSITATTIDAVKTVSESLDTDGIRIETMAQVCALHTRYSFNFEKHAFLLKINEFKNRNTILKNYDVEIHAVRESAGKEAFSYSVSARCGNETVFEGTLITAVTDYNDSFNKKKLQDHYRNLFICLTQNM